MAFNQFSYFILEEFIYLLLSSYTSDCTDKFKKTWIHHWASSFRHFWNVAYSITLLSALFAGMLFLPHPESILSLPMMLAMVGSLSGGLNLLRGGKWMSSWRAGSPESLLLRLPSLDHCSAAILLPVSEIIGRWKYTQVLINKTV